MRRLGVCGLILGMVLMVAASQHATATAGPALFERDFQGEIATKFNAAKQAPVLHDAQINTGDFQKLLSLSISAPDGAPGTLSIDTSDTATWKLPMQTAANTYTITTKATSATTAGVHINGQYRPLQVGTKLTVKLSPSLDSAYVKLTGMAPNGIGATKVAVESETKGAGLDWRLSVIVVFPSVNGVLLPPDYFIGIGFNKPIDGIDASGVTLDCGDGPVPISVSALTMAIHVIPDSPLTDGATCTFTILADAPSDADSIDPPSGMAEDFVQTFTVGEPG